MSDKQPINKYIDALNNLVGMDVGYLGDSDENVNTIVELIKRVAELEDMIEQNMLIKLPCKVGDTVYWVVRDYDWNGKAQGFIIEQGKFRYACLDYWNFSCFLTKAEAEAEIERIERERNVKQICD